MLNRAIKKQGVAGAPAASQTKQRSKREPRIVIVSFRLRESEAQVLRQDMDANPSAGVRSLKQFARKLTIDYARGRLVYVNKMDRLIDPYSRDSVNLDGSPEQQT